MGGGKRGNEHSQLRKEEYEALMNGGGGEVTANGFQRADPESLGRRKIVRARRPAERPASEQTGGKNAFAALASSMQTAAPKPATGLFSFGGQSNNAVAPAATGTGLFSFGNQSNNATAPAAASGSLFSFSSNNNATTSHNTAVTSSVTAGREMNQFEKNAAALDKSFADKIKNLSSRDIGSNLEPLIDKYNKYAAAQLKQWAEENPEKAKAKEGAAAASSSSPGAPTGGPPKKDATASSSPSKSPAPATTFGSNTKPPPKEEAPKSNFSFGFTAGSNNSSGAGAPSNAAAALAPAPSGGFSGFQFGIGVSSPAPASTNTLSFGKSNSDSSTNMGSSSGGFQFGGKAAAPTGGLNFAAATEAANKAATPSPGFTFSGEKTNGDNDEDAPIPADDTSKIEEKPGDDGWDEIRVIEPVTMFRHADHKDSTSPWSKFAHGKLRLQRSQNNPKLSRIVMRDEAGTRVLVNSTIKSDLKLNPSEKTVEKTKKVIGSITFAVVTERGYEGLLARSRKEVHDELLKALQELIDQAKE